MLKKLSIRNYALIDSLDLEFDSGLTIITGETGAGKSIMLGALSLLLGGRADTKVIADSSSKAIVEALFSGLGDEFRHYFEENDLDWNDGGIIIRREIAANGRSRVFVNDCPVTLSMLSDLTPRLIDIHSQHSNARIADPQAQLEIIDLFSQNDELRNEYRNEFEKYVSIRNRIKRIKDRIEKATADKEYLLFRRDRLDKLKPRRGELAEIEKRFEMLSDADEIRERLSEMSRFLSTSDGGASDLTSRALSVSDGVDFTLFGGDESDSSSSVSSRLESVLIELKDLYETIEEYASEVEADPAALSKLGSRIDAYYDAMKTFKVTDADMLPEIYEDICGRLASIEEGDAELPELEKEARAVAHRLKALAEQLSESRHEGACVFARQINETARPLGLPNMNFDVSFSEGKLSLSGKDKVELVCAFNKNQIPSPVSKSASGGEISRLMLTMKGLLAGKMNLPTIIFDEVDTGVSGDIADKMGAMMVEMGAAMQVMAITHLPQVAAKGKSHFKVYKTDSADRTITHVRELSTEERIREIAGMISGSSIGDAALENARHLLGL